MLANALLTPNPGLMFWTLLIFIILLVVLRKVAWGPITTALKTREQSIDMALNEAKSARAEVENLKARNEEELRHAREEREKIRKEALEAKERILTEAKLIAIEESKRLIDAAHQTIKIDQARAMADLKAEVVYLSIQAASRILGRELSNGESQEDLVHHYLQDVANN